MSAHAEFLCAASANKELASQLKADFRKANLTQRDFRMLEFVEKLTLFPWLLVETDIRLLARAGFSDSQLLHIVLGTAHFNYLNRMADGIGIQFEYKTEIQEFKVPDEVRPSRSLDPPAPRSPDPNRNTAVAWISLPETVEPLERPRQLVNLFRVMGHNPAARDLAREWRAYQLTGTAALDARTRARLALFISSMNRCDYSLYWFGKVLQGLGASQGECDELSTGRQPESLTLKDQLLFEHAERLTCEPWTTREGDIQNLREAGLDDHGILQLTMLCSYLSFENRVAQGLGVALESGTE